MTIDVSIIALGKFFTYTFFFVLSSIIALFFCYYPNEPFKGKINNIIFITIEIILFLLIYGWLEVNWVE